jgi:hypothetical protein
MPSVTDIDSKMKEWCREWTRTPFLPNGASSGVFNDLWEIIEEYYRKHLRQHLGIHVNFERVLGEMTALASWVTPSPFGNALKQAVRDGGLSKRFTWSSPPPDAPFFYQVVILDQLAYLLGKLADYMRKRSKALKKEALGFDNYRKILSRLRDEFEVGIYNLNYDNVAVSAWPDAFTGFLEGEFDARGLGLRREWQFIYHLHGSVHYSFTDEPPFARVLVWKDDLDSTFKNSLRTPTTMGQNFTPIVPTTLIAGGFKLDQLLADPFQTFHAALIRHAHEADAVLIAGYGFGDVHVNRALENRYSLFPYDASRRPPAVVLTKSHPSFRSTAERQEYDLWGNQLTRTLNTSFDSKMPIKQLIDKRIFEKDLHGCLAIWHGGFAEAADSFDDVIAKLSR